MEKNKEKIDRLKKLNNLFYALALLFAVLFILKQVFLIDLTGFLNFHPKGYVLLTVFAGGLLALSAFLEYRISKLKEEKINLSSLVLDIVLAVLIIAYGIYQFNLPVGYCPFNP